MRKKYTKRIAGIVLVVLTVVCYVHFMQMTVANMGDPDYRTLKYFYHEKPKSLDVVMMGSSEIAYGYSAAEVYRSEGFTSYPYAFTINPVLLWKYELEDIERTQNPKVLLIETNGALYKEDKYLDEPNCVNILTEAMPMSGNRVRAAFRESDHPMERLVPFIKYHYKWTDLRDIRENTNLMLWRQGHAKLRGAYSMLYRGKIDTRKLRPHDDKCAPLNDRADKALREFLDQCKNSEIEHIVFVEYPHILKDQETYERHQRAKTAEKIIREAGFDYIDLSKNARAEGLDYKTDFFDADHLMATGQRKTSRYLGKVVKERYLSDIREQSEENRKEWEESAVLIDRYYRLYDKYTGEHADDPYKKVFFKLLENYRIMGDIEAMDEQ